MARRPTWRRVAWVLLFGFAGVAVLLKLGFWQLDRLEGKAGLLGRMEAKLAARPVEVPRRLTPPTDRFLPVHERGSIAEGEIHVYTAAPGGGAGYRVIVPFLIQDGRRVLLDRGLVPIEEKDAPRRLGEIAVTGMLDWPDETDAYTPEPDRDKNIWFARDVAAMAGELETEPVMIVTWESDDPDQPLPLWNRPETPNKHREYAVTWFGLAAVWAGMTGYSLWRIKRRID